MDYSDGRVVLDWGLFWLEMLQRSMNECTIRGPFHVIKGTSWAKARGMELGEKGRN